MNIVNHPGNRQFHDRRTAAFAPAQNLVACIVPFGPQRFRGYAEARDYIMDHEPLFWRHLIKKYEDIGDITAAVYRMVRYNCQTGKPGWGIQ